MVARPAGFTLPLRVAEIGPTPAACPVWADVVGVAVVVAAPLAPADPFAPAAPVVPLVPVPVGVASVEAVICATPPRVPELEDPFEPSDEAPDPDVPVEEEPVAEEAFADEPPDEALPDPVAADEAEEPFVAEAPVPAVADEAAAGQFMSVSVVSWAFAVARVVLSSASWRFAFVTVSSACWRLDALEACWVAVEPLCAFASALCACARLACAAWSVASAVAGSIVPSTCPALTCLPGRRVDRGQCAADREVDRGRVRDPDVAGRADARLDEAAGDGRRPLRAGPGRRRRVEEAVDLVQPEHDRDGCDGAENEIERETARAMPGHVRARESAEPTMSVSTERRKSVEAKKRIRGRG